MNRSGNYHQQVYDVTKMIPKGRVSTYGAIADFLALGSARMVGWALNQCHHQEDVIPAHRVVNRKGELSGRMMFESPTKMQELLEAEDVEIKNDRVQNFDVLFWHPKELEIDIAD